MERRDFLQSAALGGLVPLLPHAGGGSDPAIAVDVRSQPVRRGELDEQSLADLAAGMAAGRWTSRDLVERYHQQIALRDAPRGGLHAVIERNPDALAIADAMDAERRAGRVRGPLHGIPILIKDNIDTGDRMQTSAGSLALVGSPAPRDAFIISRLREAGAVLLGKTNLSEFANFRSSRSSSGWSSRGGQTRNPYVLDRNPCGSSSGSAVAAAANLCAIAIGTETDGSIVCPSSANGIVGFKPTVGLWSRTGILPISVTQDTAGPMGRSVSDVATLLGPLTGLDPDDSATGASTPHRRADYRDALRRDALQGKRIGILRSAFGFHERVDRLLEDAIASLRAAGAEIVDPVTIDAPRGVGGWENTVLSYEFKDGINRYLARRGGVGPVRSLSDIIAFNEAHAATTMPYFGQETLLRSAQRGTLEEQVYREAHRQLLQGAREQGIDATLATHRLDAIMAPTGGPAWVTDVLNGDHFGGGSSGHAARAGYPNVTLPIGFVAGLPVGMSLFTTAWHDAELLGMAFAFEQHHPARRPPTFLPSLVTNGP
ncbi:MAG TPA: amidase [Gemmatimonadales bacterium]|nr:amidase [Gemmatimonadales bacterium]